MVQLYGADKKPWPICTLLQTDCLLTQSPLFQGYNTLTSEFQNRDPRMAMTFIVPGSTIFFEGGFLQPTFPGFLGTQCHTEQVI